jgi:hypothetical protein
VRLVCDLVYFVSIFGSVCYGIDLGNCVRSTCAEHEALILVTHGWSGKLNVFYVEIGVLTCCLSVVVTCTTYYACSTTCLTGIVK